MKLSTTLIIAALSAAPFGCTQSPENGAPPKSATGNKRPGSSASSAEAPPAAPVRARLVIPAGTQLPVEIETTISTATSKEGDLVVGKLVDDVTLPGFKLEKGAEVRGAVVTAVAASRVKGQARLVVTFNAVMKGGEKLSITTDPIDSTAKSTKSSDTKIIAGSAVGGLILGAIKDGKKGAAIGTVIGAAAGTGAVLILKGDEVELPRGAKVTVTVIR